MRNLFITTIILVMTFIVACNNFSKPQVQLSGTSPYQLTIFNFNWNYGLTEVNKLNGDFETLDRKVFNLLQHKEGTCSVNLYTSSKDRYGRPQSGSTNIGTIDLNELHRYESWEYWHKDGGIQKLLYRHLFPVADSATSNNFSIIDNSTKPDSSALSGHIDSAISFTYNDLYSNVADRDTIDSLGRIDSGFHSLDGVITGVYPSRGIIKIHSEDILATHFIRVYPYKAQSNRIVQLIWVLHVGNHIHGMCVSSTGITEQLVSANITVTQ